MSEEKWAQVTVEPYNTKYQISSEGRIKSLHSKTPKILKTTLRSEYLGVPLCIFGKSRTFSIHRLVAQAFIPNPDNHPVVNHKNGNKLDNRVENLEWVSSKENNAHAVKNSLKVNRCFRVSQYTLDNTLVKTFDSVRQAMKETGIRDTRICQTCKGNIPSCGGYLWEYTDMDWQDTPVPDGKIYEPFVNYIITKDGQVYSKSFKKFISQKTNAGYKYVTIYNTNRETKVRSRKDVAVHILVASVFLENPRKLPYVNHKNYNKADNRAENLEWCSPSENMVHSAKKNDKTC